MINTRLGAPLWSVSTRVLAFGPPQVLLGVKTSPLSDQIQDQPPLLTSQGTDQARKGRGQFFRQRLWYFFFFDGYCSEEESNSSML